MKKNKYTKESFSKFSFFFSHYQFRIWPAFTSDSFRNNSNFRIVYYTFCNAIRWSCHLLALFVLDTFINQSLLLSQQWFSWWSRTLCLLTSACVDNLSDTLPITCLSTSQSGIQTSTPTEYVQVSGTSSSFFQRKKKTSWLNSHWEILVNNTSSVKYMVICFLELQHVWRVPFLSYDITQIRVFGSACRFWILDAHPGCIPILLQYDFAIYSLLWPWCKPNKRTAFQLGTGRRKGSLRWASELADLATRVQGFAR